jgi:hypothetical protein
MPDDAKRPELELERERLELERFRVQNELEIKRLEFRRAPLRDPLILALCGAIVALLGNASVAYFNGKAQRELERAKAQANLILESVQTDGDREAAARNLYFLVESGLVDDPMLTERIFRMGAHSVPTLPSRHAGLDITSLRANPSLRSLLVLANGAVVHGQRYFLEGDFQEENGGVDRNLGAGACITAEYCIVAGDRNRYASPFRLDPPRTILPVKERIYLRSTSQVADPDAPKLDIEAVSYYEGHFLFVGSHSVSLNNGCHRKERHGVFLVPVHPLTGRSESASDGTPPKGLREASLDYVLARNETFAPFFDLLLQRGGVNVEGAAFQSNTVWIGMRAPSAGRQLLLIKLNRDDFFGGKRSPNRRSSRSMSTGTALEFVTWQWSKAALSS